MSAAFEIPPSSATGAPATHDATALQWWSRRHRHGCRPAGCSHPQDGGAGHPEQQPGGQHHHHGGHRHHHRMRMWAAAAAAAAGAGAPAAAHDGGDAGIAADAPREGARGGRWFHRHHQRMHAMWAAMHPQQLAAEAAAGAEAPTVECTEAERQQRRAARHERRMQMWAALMQMQQPEQAQQERAEGASAAAAGSRAATPADCRHHGRHHRHCSPHAHPHPHHAHPGFGFGFGRRMHMWAAMMAAQQQQGTQAAEGAAEKDLVPEDAVLRPVAVDAPADAVHADAVTAMLAELQLRRQARRERRMQMWAAMTTAQQQQVPQPQGQAEQTPVALAAPATAVGVDQPAQGAPAAASAAPAGCRFGAGLWFGRRNCQQHRRPHSRSRSCGARAASAQQQHQQPTAAAAPPAQAEAPQDDEAPQQQQACVTQDAHRGEGRCRGRRCGSAGDGRRGHGHRQWAWGEGRRHALWTAMMRQAVPPAQAAAAGAPAGDAGGVNAHAGPAAGQTQDARCSRPRAHSPHGGRGGMRGRHQAMAALMSAGNGGDSHPHALFEPHVHMHQHHGPQRHHPFGRLHHRRHGGRGASPSRVSAPAAAAPVEGVIVPTPHAAE